MKGKVYKNSQLEGRMEHFLQEFTAKLITDIGTAIGQQPKLWQQK